MKTMDHRDVRHYWDGNAAAWTALARAGYDIYRDGFNSPGFFAMLPAVDGLHGLDLGCGEGHNTRLLAARGARVTALDVSGVFVRAALQYATQQGLQRCARFPRGIAHLQASAVELPFAAACFDFIIATMVMMDLPETERALAEAWRVLRPGGFLQFSIMHPCFNPPHRRNLRDAHGHSYAIEVGKYFERGSGDVQQWTFSAAPPEATAGFEPFKVPTFHRTLSEWINTLLRLGFQLEEIQEPMPDDDMVRREPALQDAQVVAYFLQIRARKA
jgi:SAM-dependent methyltransferase